MCASALSIVSLYAPPADALKTQIGWAQEEDMMWSWLVGGPLRGRT